MGWDLDGLVNQAETALGEKLMSEEEIRMECLKLAASMMGDLSDVKVLFELSDIMFNYVMQINEEQENKIEFEKINALRPME